MKKHYFDAEDWDLMKKLMRKGVRLYCEEQGLYNDKDFRIVSLSTNNKWGHILNFSRCCDYPMNQDRKWEPFDAFYGKVYCDEDELKNIMPQTIINSEISESMKLDEAKEILKQHNFILEGKMNLEDKLNNAKKFNNIGPGYNMSRMRKLIHDLNHRFMNWEFNIADPEDKEITIVAQYNWTGNKKADYYEYVWYTENSAVHIFAYKEDESLGQKCVNDITDADQLEELIIKNFKKVSR